MGILRHPPLVVLFAAVRRPTLTRIADPGNIKSMPTPSGCGLEWRGPSFTTRLKNRHCTQAPRKLFPVVLPGRQQKTRHSREPGFLFEYGVAETYLRLRKRAHYRRKLSRLSIDPPVNSPSEYVRRGASAKLDRRPNTTSERGH